MGHSQEEKALSRERIVNAAARRIRECGLNGFSIADVMKDAELTHGGFYGHFASRAELMAAALEKALHESEIYEESTQPSLNRMVRQYLSRTHRDTPISGCAVSALASEVVRSDEQTRAIMDAHLQRHVETISRAVQRADGEQLAIPITCLMVGALTLSRLVNDKQFSDRILKDAREYIFSVAGE
ncbi:TetR/AcrR family transcriptional regulator [Proteobacteria bacterium 005FR1]|nr:TetR/AcrR family transcriptional regulator [Proteobacteria bacterium 005FR1]